MEIAAALVTIFVPAIAIVAAWNFFKSLVQSS